MEQSKNVSFPTGRLGGTRAWYKEGSEAPPPLPHFKLGPLAIQASRSPFQPLNSNYDLLKQSYGEMNDG